MADVNLSVAVTSAGVGQAVAELNRLKQKGLETSSALGGLAKASTAVMAAITQASAGTTTATHKMAGYKDAMSQASAATQKLNADLAQQSRLYKEQAKNDPGSTARQRLTRAGGSGGLTAGLAIALAQENKELSKNASLSRDRQQVLREDIALVNAQAKAISAKGQIEAASFERGLNGLSRQEQAQRRLLRAQQEELAARKALATATGTAKGADPVAEAARQDQLAAARTRVARAIEQETRATRELASATSSANDNMGNAFQSSFSYFIIAGMAQQAAQAILSVGSAAITASSEIERAFADTERTFEGNAAQLASLQGSLRELATETPISIIDLAQIATLGNQLGVAQQDIQSFTQTIAQYTAVSGQSAEDAATAFGRISNLTGLAASQYSNLASSITYVARTSVATESTIQNTAKEITALASGAGFSADAIVGLAGALSSLAIPPERARGALSLYFGALNSAVAEGGPKLEAFAQLTGKTTDELNRLVRENRGQEVFTAFISGLSELDSVAKTTALDTLGLSTIRVDQTMRALSQNVPLVTDAFAGASQAFEENTEIANQYAIIQDTLASKIIEFQNAIQLAAGAVGDSMAPALKELVSLITDIIVNFTAFANSPIGKWVVGIAGAVAGLVLVMATLIGAAALVKASLVVIPWALSGLQASGASRGLAEFVAGLFGIRLAAPAAVAGNEAVAVSATAVGATSRAAAAGLRVMKIALAATGIGLAVVLIGTLVEALMGANEASKLTADNVAGLQDALAADTKTYNDSGQAIQTFAANAGQTTEEQKKAAEASANWANVLGNDLVSGANAASEAISKVAAGDQTVEAFRQALANLGEDDPFTQLISDSNFSNSFQNLGLDMTKLIEAGIKSGGNSGILSDTIDQMLAEAGVKIQQFTDREGTHTVVTDAQGKNITNFYTQLQTLIPTLASTSTATQGLINKNNVLADRQEALAGSTEELTDNFLGAVPALTKFQDSLQSGLAKYVDIGSIIGGVNEALAKAIEDGEDYDLLGNFSAQLDAANTSASNFYTDIATLAAAGSGTFATELASLGPDAQGILSSALDLDAEGQGKLEAAARFAGFLASDEFKAALQAGMTDANAAYARVFEQSGGDFQQVRDLIAAQIAGPDAVAEYERLWAINHPGFPLNLTPSLSQPTDGDIDIWEQQISGKLTITPIIGPPGSDANVGSTIYTDNVTGKSIELPATLSGQALSDSLKVWQANQNASPEQLAAELNKPGLSKSLDDWVAAHGPVTLYVTFVPLNNPGDSVGTITGPVVKKANGGEIEMPKFARGGGYGVFKGRGSGTSDDILARVSAGEYINTDSSRRFWGADFFDSLNRKMLPSSFLDMLKAASVSGNSGPSHVTHVQTTLVNPVSRDPYNQMREKSERIALGQWGSDD